MTTPLGQLATKVRSKNAGPFWTTIDAFFADRTGFDRAVASPVTDPQVIGERYAVAPEAVRIFPLPDLLVIKVSFPRPSAQGGIGDRDMHAGQQHVPLLDLEIP
ncbi:DUF4387 domain-containing protein [soil metagenome]